ncbi:hypothetical protein [Agarivorans sp. QJM3NY_25]|uniref:hypothetical protein n=1 Tax=Agarivorans sp. QJM3NY_25 TaxID=3421430 RepID=UPI003D7D0497
MITLDSLTLPEGLYWYDFDYCAIQQTRQDSLTGRVILQRGQMQEGRPITLLGSTESCWLSRTAAAQIASLRDQAEAMHLNIAGRSFTVRFDLSQSEHLLLRPLHSDSMSHAANDAYTLTKLALIEVLE